MWCERVKAYPDGSVYFISNDRVVTIRRNKPPTIRIITNKDKYGIFDGLGNLPSHSREFISDELLDDFPTLD